jgi:hypothetical protein
MKRRGILSLTVRNRTLPGPLRGRKRAWIKNWPGSGSKPVSRSINQYAAIMPIA